MPKLINAVKSKSKRGTTVKRSQTNTIHNQSLLLYNKTSISIINAVTDCDECELAKTPCNIGVKAEKDSVETDDIYTQFATLFKNPNTIMIPTKVKKLLAQYLPKNILDKIHGEAKTEKNRKVAVELCLLFLSQLSSTHRNILNGSDPEGWKTLRAEYLRQLLWIKSRTYLYVIEALKYEFDKGSILEQGFYVIGEYSYEYRLGSTFRSKGFVPYNLQTETVRDLFKRSIERKLSVAKRNVICINLMEFYKSIVLPTEEEILVEAKILVELGYTNKKGKRLIFNNKKRPGFYPNSYKLVFVENSLKVYDYLTKNGLLIPSPGDEKSGGRVVDSHTLMPSWIRKLIKINGQPIAEADFSCLHPNIAMTLYGGSSQYLTHEELADQLGIEKRIVKVEHLSFFNATVWQMRRSPLYTYYEEHEPVMLRALINEKQESVYGHKITSRRLFAKEVEIMTQVVSRLNEEGIFVGYIYDALFFDPIHSQKVVQVMNEVTIALGVFTIAKL